METRAEWQKWIQEHATENRDAWARGASDQVVELAKKDIPAAKKQIERAVYSHSWDDPMMLPAIARLVGFRDLRRVLLAWCNQVESQFGSIPGSAAKVGALKVRINRERGI